MPVLHIGETTALATFRRAAAEVDAYREFLAARSIRPDAIRTLEEFQQVPVTDKASYIRRYPMAKLVGADGMAGAWALQSSSGFSGSPVYWPRLVSDGPATWARSFSGSL